MMNTNDMTQGKILPVLIRFTIPILIGDLFQQLYNIVDTIIVGRTLGPSALAAVGATGTIMFLVIGVSIALANGFAVVTSQRFGAKDYPGIRKSFASSVIMMLFIGAMATFLSLKAMPWILKTMNTPKDIFADSHAYISVICMGMLATIFYNLFAASLRAIGNSRIPLYFLILSSVLNIFLDLFFIVCIGMGVEGAALATIMGQSVSVVLCAIYIWKKEKLLLPEKGEWRLDKNIVIQQMIIGIPMALQNAVTASGTMIMQTATNGFGSVAVAATTAGGKCRMIFTQPMMSMGVSMATYCGQNYGHKDMERVEKGVWMVIRIFIVYSLVVAGILCLGLPWELRLFFSGSGSVEELLPFAKIYIYEAAICFIPLSWIFIFRSSMQGYGRSILAMLAGIVELATRLFLASLAMHTMNFYIACLCDPGAWLTGGIYTLIAFAVSVKRTAGKIQEEQNAS